MITSLAGFGHAVRSIDQVTQVYTSLWGLPLAKHFTTPLKAVKRAILPVPPNFFELLEPTEPSSPLARFLDRRGEGIYHLTLVVDNVEKEIHSLRQKGVEIRESSSLEPPFQLSAWIHPRSTMGVLIQIVDANPLVKLELQNTSRQGLIAKISHVHHIVKDLDKAVALYERLWGLQPNQRYDYPQEGFSNAIIPIGSNYIGILCSTHSKNPLTGFLEKHGEGLRSVCFMVDDIERAVASLRAQGVEPMVQEPSHHTPFKAAWVSPRYTRGLVVELFPATEAIPYMAGH